MLLLELRTLATSYANHDLPLTEYSVALPLHCAADGGLFVNNAVSEYRTIGVHNNAMIV